MSFKEDIQPIFNSNCVTCHNEEHQYLDLREGKSYDQLSQNGANAPYIVAGKPGKSLLYERVTGI
ncbi:MAG: hypothetical protein ABEH43_09390, partial [Flavobacteriales bacterium]